MLAGDVNRAASPKEIILNPHSEPAGVCVCVCVCVCVLQQHQISNERAQLISAVRGRDDSILLMAGFQTVP